MNVIEKFINEISEAYNYILSVDEIKEELEVNSIFEDMPISTGKRLILEFLKFTGKKDNGEIINFNQEFKEGINIIIADNLKGKSTTFKIIKAALTGDVKSNSIKADVRRWIEEIILGFKINDKKYTIHINIESRFKGSLYSIDWKIFLKNNFKCDDAIFKNLDNKSYIEAIQKFFFNQFSYYSLKWTQKSSAKDSNKLLEAGASWKTYYKSIYLESKDSGNFYGGQDQKLFQMLLGLEYTHLINRLVVKKDMLQFEISKEKEYSYKRIEQNKNDRTQIELRLEEVKSQIEYLDNKSNINKILELKSIYNKNLQQVNDNNKKILDLNNSYKQLDIERQKLFINIDSKKVLKNKILKEIKKSKRQLIDLNEYISIEQFFSNLEIKCCPSCNHKVESSHKIKSEGECPLCHEQVNQEESDKDIYLDKIRNLDELVEKLNKELDLIDNERINLEDDLNRLNDKINLIIIQIEDIELKNKNIDTINISKEISDMNCVDNDYIEKERKLIEEYAVLKYKLGNTENHCEESDNIIKMDAKLRLLVEAISYLEQKRHDQSSDIMDVLKSIMLKEIHEFGLKSITDIHIDSKFNITYVQNEVPMKFENISEGEQLRVKIAFYLAIIQMDIEKNFGRHTRFLIIDSPNKEEGDFTYLEGLKDTLLNIDNRYGNNLQIIIGTATRELEDILRNQIVYKRGEYVF